MTSFEALRIQDFDHLEFAVADLDRAAELYLRLGFEKAGTREILERRLRSYLMVQNHVAILLSHSALPTDPVGAYVAAHGDGIINIAFHCEDAVSALELAVSRGAEVAESPKAYKKDFGEVQQAAIKAFGDVRHTFITRQGNLFAEGFELAVKAQNKGYGLERIDHITCNVEKGQLDQWTDYYERIFGLKNTGSFDIHTSRTGLHAKVLQSPNGVIKMPVNEPSDGNSQIQEFIEVHHGAGVQHVALQTSRITDAVRSARQEGIRFLDVPSAYYEPLKARLPQLVARLGELEELAILADGDSSGYLLQIFTEKVVGSFFYEFVQRSGNDGFGEHSLTALFEAIENDQIRRGVLKD